MPRSDNHQNSLDLTIFNRQRSPEFEIIN
uniref:Kinesin motor domain-containing protein n=1 Tax=Heterorhabditis bacteriophora TaxID=37862 RepID=A0A1I7WJI0_HETBA